MRKKIVRAISVISAVACVTLSYGYVNANCVRRKEYVLLSDKVDHTVRILLISDLHYGTAQRNNVLADTIKDLNNVKADILILSGDVVQQGRTTKEDMYRAFELLGSVKTKYGAYFVSGNHDFIIEQSPDAIRPYYTKSDLFDVLDRNGISLLDGSVEEVAGIRLIGRSDKATCVGNVRSNIHIPADDKYTVVIDHDPNNLDVSQFEYDLQLSGHTHAGQVFPVNLYVESYLGYIYGRYDVGNKSLIVTSGMGVGRYPIRTCKHCEYVVITIKPDK